MFPNLKKKKNVMNGLIMGLRNFKFNVAALLFHPYELAQTVRYNLSAFRRSA